jgi:ATP adenylyltransferase
MKYVRKLIKTEGCVFCTSATQPKSFETLCVYQSKLSQIVLNKYPYNSGHLLVLPNRHCGDLLELNEEEYNDLHKTLKLAIQAVTQVYQPNGFNLGLNHGATGGAGIPDHLHYHIVPRWNGDLNFFPLIAETKLVIEEVEQTYQRYQTFFGSIK